MSDVEAHGWTILAHPLLLEQLEALVAAAEREARHRDSIGPNTKLLAHLLDLAFDKIPRDPGHPAFRHGGALGDDRRNWFRGKTGNGRYRLFYRFQSSSRLIVYVWVNDETSLRTHGSATDAYTTFAKMLETGNPPSDWDALVRAAGEPTTLSRLTTIAQRQLGDRTKRGRR